MRILHAYPEIISKGGRPHDCRELATHLARRGHDVKVVGMLRPEEHGRVFPDNDVSLQLLRQGPGWPGNFRRLVDEAQPDIIHFTGGPRIPVQNSWARQAHRLRIPYVLSACGNLSEPTYYHRWGNKSNHFYHPWLKRLYFSLFDAPMIKRAAFVHAASETEAGIATRCGAGRTEVIPFGMDDRWINNDERAVDPQSDQITFTYLGRLSIVHKGLDVIVDAFGLLRERGHGDKVHLVMAGTAENGSMDELAQRASAAGITNIEFPGGVWGDEKQKLWNRTHYFLHMCRFNGFALATREALGQGIPILATMESDFGDWVKRFEMGAVVPVSAEGLANEIESILRGRPNYAQLANGAMKYAEETRWDRVAEQMESAYMRVLGRSEKTVAGSPGKLQLTGQ